MNRCYRDVLLMQEMLKDLTKISCGIVIHIQRGGKNINSGMNLYFQRRENRATFSIKGKGWQRKYGITAEREDIKKKKFKPQYRVKINGVSQSLTGFLQILSLAGMPYLIYGTHPA